MSTVTKMQTVNLLKPLTTEETQLTTFVDANEKVRKLALKHKGECGEFRRSINDLREAMLSSMLSEGVTQMTLPENASNGEMQFARVKTYRSAKTISDKVVDEAFDKALRDINMAEQGWKDSLLQLVTDQVRQAVVTKKQYVDITTHGQKPGTLGISEKALTHDHVMSRIGMELQQAKCQMKDLKEKQKSALQGPKQVLDELRNSVTTRLFKEGVDRIRVNTPSAKQPDLFVTTRVSYASKKLSMRSLKEIVASTLQQCGEDCTQAQLKATIMDAVKTFRIGLEQEQETVTVHRAPRANR